MSLRLSRPGPTPFLRTVLTLSMSLLVVACADHKQALQLKLSPGDTFILAVRGTQEISLVDPDGKPSELSGKIEERYEFDVKSIREDGAAEIRITIQSAQLPLMNAPLGRAIKGQTFGFGMDAMGRIVDFYNTEALREKVAKIKLPASMFPGTEAEQEAALDRFMASQVKIVSDEALRGKFERYFRIWPPTPVTVGDAWHRESIREARDGVTNVTHFTVESWNEGEVTLAGHSSLLSTGKHAVRRLSGEAQSKVVVDAANGMLKTMSLERELRGQVLNEGSGPTTVTISEQFLIEVISL